MPPHFSLAPSQAESPTAAAAASCPSSHELGAILSIAMSMRRLLRSTTSGLLRATTTAAPEAAAAAEEADSPLISTVGGAASGGLEEEKGDYGSSSSRDPAERNTFSPSPSSSSVHLSHRMLSGREDNGTAAVNGSNGNNGATAENGTNGAEAATKTSGMHTLSVTLFCAEPQI